VVFDSNVGKVLAEAQNGSFCILPRHVDFVAPLVPGILSFTVEEREVFAAIDEGILVKKGETVLVSTRNAVVGTELGELRRTVEKQFRNLDDRDRESRLSGQKLEGELVRKFIEFQEL
jgi:F-type H+-transporting ATPase subunit epsilon